MQLGSLLAPRYCHLIYGVRELTFFPSFFRHPDTISSSPGAFSFLRIFIPYSTSFFDGWSIRVTPQLHKCLRLSPYLADLTVSLLKCFFYYNVDKFDTVLYILLYYRNVHNAVKESNSTVAWCRHISPRHTSIILFYNIIPSTANVFSPRRCCAGPAISLHCVIIII